MTNEIKRNYWAKFCKKFNSANQYRPAIINFKAPKGEATSISPAPFMGVTLTRSGRFFDTFQVIAGRPDPETVTQPILTIKEPEKIFLEKDKNGHDARLLVKSKDGAEARLDLNGERQEKQAESLVEQLAYSFFERRGYATGNDKDDWYEAERRLRNAEAELKM